MSRLAVLLCLCLVASAAAGHRRHSVRRVSARRFLSGNSTTAAPTTTANSTQAPSTTPASTTTAAPTTPKPTEKPTPKPGSNTTAAPTTKKPDMTTTEEKKEEPTTSTAKPTDVTTEAQTTAKPTTTEAVTTQAQTTAKPDASTTTTGAPTQATTLAAVQEVKGTFSLVIADAAGVLADATKKAAVESSAKSAISELSGFPESQIDVTLSLASRRLGASRRLAGLTVSYTIRVPAGQENKAEQLKTTMTGDVAKNSIQGTMNTKLAAGNSGITVEVQNVVAPTVDQVTTQPPTTTRKQEESSSVRAGATGLALAMAALAFVRV